MTHQPSARTYRVRVDLTGTEPPLWRGLDVASDMRLDELHDVLQAAFGWTDSHLHRFARGTEAYVTAFDLAEGEDGVAEQEVRLDELLAEVGDALDYVYDFGDDWRHTVRLEAVLPRAGSAPRATCTGGERPGPPEDCGGVRGYELISAAADPAHPDHAEALAELAGMYGIDAVPDDLAPTPFDVDAINHRLAHPPVRLPGPLQALLQAVRLPDELDHLAELVHAAALDEPVEIDPEAAAAAVRPYTWLLDRVGEDGIALTAAGYLPPAHVRAAMTELGMAQEWIGTHNRESRTVPVLHLRESAQKLGLLRKHRGSLRLTTSGRRLRTDAVGLWWHLAERLPLGRRDAVAAHAGLVLLLAVAAGVQDDHDTVIVRALQALGWTSGGGRAITRGDAADVVRDTRMVLRRLGALVRDRRTREHRPTPSGAAFARAALTT